MKGYEYEPEQCTVTTITYPRFDVSEQPSEVVTEATARLMRSMMKAHNESEILRDEFEAF